MKKSLFLGLFMLIGYNYVLAQTPAVDMTITISDGAGGSQELGFGLDPSATDGIDVGLGEEALPPFPPSTVFEARFIGEDISLSQLDQGVYRDYRTGDAAFNGTKIHELRYQVGSGTIIQISWDLPDGVSGQLEDFVGGSVSMNGSGSYTVTNPGTISKLKMIINYQPLPSKPPLLSPSNGSSLTDQTPTLDWQGVSGATGFDVQLDNNSDFSSPVINTSTTASIYTLSSNLSGGTYYWRVRAKNSAGPGPWSPTWSFSIVTAPGEPTLLSPSDATSLTDQIPTLVWQAVSGATGYDLVIDDNQDFTSSVINTSTTAGVFTPSSDLSSGKYYWRVRAKNSAGAGPWSSTWNFTIIITGVEKRKRNDIPKSFWLSQNFPNPFNPGTEIQFALPMPSDLVIKIYDITGKKMNILVQEHYQSGYYAIHWDGKDSSGKPVPNGTYLYQLQAGDYTQAKKMLLIR
jgi:hypothetical protein